MEKLQLTSPAFEHTKDIPLKYGGAKENINPPLEIANIPKEAKSLVLIMDDPDAVPVAGFVWDHWIMWNIPLINAIAENSAPGVQGLNSAKENAYGGPKPPDKTHRYVFKLYAVDTLLELPETATKKDVEEAMQGHIIEQAELVGLYSPE